MSAPPATAVRFTVELGGLTLPTPNSRLHWAARARSVKEVRDLVAIQAQSARNRLGILAAVQRMRVTLVLVRGKGQRMLDPDNATAACKPVLDGLVTAGWLVDDAPKWCELTVTQRRGERAQVKCTVEEIGSLAGPT